jgi:hypothetical protein
MAVSPASQGGAGCASSPHTIKNTNESNFQMKHFFDFLGRHGILSVRLAAQTRKKDGQRGAPLGFGQPGRRVAEAPPVRTGAAAGLAPKLLEYLEHMTKKNLELVTSAAEDSQGLSKSILIDDLDRDGVLLVKTKWRGPGVILETSPGNYQSVLILPAGLDRTDRTRITRQLVELAGGDTGAAGPNQLHRLPGSVNYKAALAEPFVTRLVEYFTGTGDGVQPVKPAPVVHRPAALAARLGVVQPLKKWKWSTPAESVSQEAFRLAVEMLAAGSTSDQVEVTLSAPEWLRHHDSEDWPARTCRGAGEFLRRVRAKQGINR